MIHPEKLGAGAAGAAAAEQWQPREEANCPFAYRARFNCSIHSLDEFECAPATPARLMARCGSSLRYHNHHYYYNHYYPSIFSHIICVPTMSSLAVFFFSSYCPLAAQRLARNTRRPLATPRDPLELRAACRTLRPLGPTRLECPIAQIALARGALGPPPPRWPMIGEQDGRPLTGSESSARL